ncbi:MAG TPA: methyltransferase regulatory domain-containing protein, partial [Pirellulaceae bacterium]|nr:methyltransferase regulatory domain-containing protein [Pirellulaceae bacterium]
RQLLAWLPDSLPGKNNPYSAALQGEAQRLSKLDDGYLCHEFLETVNHPVLVRDFLGELDRRGLRYLGEAEYRTMTAADVPAAARQQIAQLTADPLRREQYYDFCRWQTFRSTLICHADVRLDTTINFERVAALSFASDVKPVDSGSLDLVGPSLHAFARGGCRVNTAHPWFKAALASLGRRWPAWSSFDALVAEAARTLGLEPPPRSTWPTIRQLVELAEALHQAYANGVVDAALDAPDIICDPSEPFIGYLPARLRAEVIPLVPNATHCVATLQGFQRHVLRLLDGRGRHAIVTQLADDTRGSLILTDAQGRQVTSVDQLREIIANTLDETLVFLAQQGLLVRPSSEVQP